MSTREHFRKDLPGSLTPGYPEMLGLEPTSVCNLSCTMCSLPARRPPSTRAPGPMPDAVLERALAPAARAGVVCVNGWGENFTDGAFLGRLEEMDRRGIVTIFSTNGTLVTREHARRLARLAHLFNVNVSLDSADPEVYRRIRGRDLEDALYGFAVLAAEPALRARMTVSAVAWERSAPGLAALPALLAARGVTTLVLQGRVPPLAPRPAAAAPPDPLLARTIDEVRGRCEAHGILLHVVPYLSWQARGGAVSIWRDRAPALARGEEAAAGSLPDTRQCGSPWEFPVIDKDGRVFPCCIAPDAGEGAAIGDLRTQTFDEIWQGEPIRRLRRALLEGHPPEPCRSCPATSIGPHFFALYAARLLPSADEVRADRAVARFTNAGASTWTRATKVRVGTTRRRDRRSPLASASWLSSTRAATFREECVAPGAEATFAFEVPADHPLEGETFQLVVEDVCWIPGTEFALERRAGLPSVRPLPRGIAPRGEAL